MSQHNLQAIALNMVGVPADCYAAYPTNKAQTSLILK